MSLFPSEHFSISLTPTSIGVAVYRGRWRPQKTELFEVPVSGQGLDAVLVSLAKELRSWTRKCATVRFTVSNRFCRVALLPWAGASLTAKEREVLAQRQFSDLYGDMDAWEIRGDTNSAYEQPCLAVAMPSELLAVLRDLPRSCGLSCRAISAHALASWNRYGAQLSGGGLFAVVEPDTTFMLSARSCGKRIEPNSGRMLALSAGQGTQELEVLIERELLLSEQMDEPVVLCDGLGSTLFGQHHSFHTVSYPADIVSPALAMAVNGALA